MSKNKSVNKKPSQAQKVTAAKVEVAEKKKEPVKASSVNNETAKTQSNTTGIIISAIVVLLLLAGIGFLVVGLAQSLNKNQSGTISSATTTATDQATASPSASPAVAEAGNKDTSSQGTTSSAQDNQAKDQANRPTTRYKQTTSTYKRGNTYTFGDITGKSYVVKKGDTLWQIAQGRYGSGLAWVEINKANGGFKKLKNGKPVNIPVGYNLILPELD